MRCRQELRGLRIVLELARHELATMDTAFEGRAIPASLSRSIARAIPQLDAIIKDFFGDSPSGPILPMALLNDTMPSKTDRTGKQIWREVYRAVEKLGADDHLLAIIGSLKDTMEDDDLLAELKAWNKRFRLARQSVTAR